MDASTAYYRTRKEHHEHIFKSIIQQTGSIEAAREEHPSNDAATGRDYEPPASIEAGNAAPDAQEFECGQSTEGNEVAMSINDNEGQVTTELEDREPEITEVEKLRSLAISQAAASAVRGIFRDEQAVADMLEERLTFDSASCSIKGLDGRSVTEHTEELYGYATHKGAKLPEPKHQTAEEKVELTILCKADLKTPDEKSAYITRWGFAKYEALALNLPRGDGQILSKADLVTPAAKSAWIAANPGKFEGLPLRRS